MFGGSFVTISGGSEARAWKNFVSETVILRRWNCASMIENHPVAAVSKKVGIFIEIC